ILDGIFGIGLNRPVQGTAAAWVEAINAAGRHVVAVDVPSGIEADTGEVMGVAVRATETITFGALKPGLLQGPGRELAGRVEVVDIGVPLAAYRDLGLELS
ncbi:MAG TPA: NAD(P)H-hydrate epimerase, partial [Solirubrobacterales bacterium]|nr:NAD(P)H-hydrate epimerase [Solirubrobacterales bacterium]